MLQSERGGNLYTGACSDLKKRLKQPLRDETEWIELVEAGVNVGDKENVLQGDLVEKEIDNRRESHGDLSLQ